MDASKIIDQDKNFLLGGKDAIKNLSEKDSASIVVVSDSHGDAKNLLTVIKDSQNCDCLIFCGDGISDLSMILGTVLASALQIHIPPVLAFVRGNNDFQTFALKNPQSGSLTNINVPPEVVIPVAGHKIFATHGHLHGVYAGLKNLREAAKKHGADVAVFGHTHVASYSNSDGMLSLNPGSSRLPRENQPKTFAKIFLERGRKPSDCVFFAIDGEKILPFKYPVLID
ncbi:MAG: YfcE family phosphodiesterase [Treponema sp.]|nr:YfcE family phosphodiesterase [Treponema sp.]